MGGSVAFDASSLTDTALRVRVGRLGSRLPQEAVHRFNTYGAVILELPEPPTVEEILGLEKSLGTIWHHQRSEPNGISVIEPTGNPPGFLGTMPDEHPPHTDGAYSDDPPRIVLLACEYAEASGGDSILVSAATAHNRVLEKGGYLLDSLYEPDALTITRNGAIARKAAFSGVAGQVGICFRKDDHSTTHATGAAAHAVRVLSDIVSTPDLQLTTTLRRGDVLLIDNCAILHGRTAFDATTGRRRMLRANFMGNGDQQLEFGFTATRQVGDVRLAG
ncbi:TauD/TfdA family dioxygenase [Kitasatospora sp. NPDC085895]|uniref:TauD/TfdA family dioxygenase n=1 Tax=Kitasatospora sp. NPDC085895 TaxID=3155057 RepID=UPI00344BA026